MKDKELIKELKDLIAEVKEIRKEIRRATNLLEREEQRKNMKEEVAQEMAVHAIKKSMALYPKSKDSR